ncbi:hypothetical protein QTP88_020864 [Uroleucon formosanum]
MLTKLKVKMSQEDSKKDSTNFFNIKVIQHDWRRVGNTTFNDRGSSESAFTRPSLNSLGCGKGSEKGRINSLIHLTSLEILAACSSWVESGRPCTTMLDKHFSRSDSSWSRFGTWLTLSLGITLIGLDSIVPNASCHSSPLNGFFTGFMEPIFRKEEFLKMFSNRFSKDMLMRYKKKKSLELSIKEKKTTVETLKVYFSFIRGCAPRKLDIRKLFALVNTLSTPLIVWSTFLEKLSVSLSWAQKKLDEWSNKGFSELGKSGLANLMGKLVRGTVLGCSVGF